MLSRAIKLNSVWGKRIVRLWVALFLPVSAYCGYLAYEEHVETIDVNKVERFYSDLIEEVEADILAAEQVGQVVVPGQSGGTTIVNGKIVRNGIQQSNEADLDLLRETKESWERAQGEYYKEKRQHETARDKYVRVALALAFLPALFLLMYRFMMWLWVGSKQDA